MEASDETTAQENSESEKVAASSTEQEGTTTEQEGTAPEQEGETTEETPNELNGENPEEEAGDDLSLIHI